MYNLKPLKLLVQKEQKAFKETNKKIYTPAVINAVINADFSKFDDFSDEFLRVYKKASAYNTYKLRKKTVKLIESSDLGFSTFDKILIKYATKISFWYDKYYLKWIKAVRRSKASYKIMHMQKESPEKLKELIKKHNLDNQYTINILENNGSFNTVPYATYFKKELRPILETFNDFTNELKKVAKTEQENYYIEYLNKYPKALSETNITKLEKTWKDVDIAWLKVKYPIQIVHDIEYDYGDPLRVKVIPDFSIRFLDSDYEKENTEIEKMKDIVVSIFEKYNTPLTNAGKNSLSKCFAGIYFLPFNSAMSLHFKFSGQSIPNRPDVKEKFGVKVYFDPESTYKRMLQVKKLSPKVISNYNDISSLLDHLHTIVYQVSAHEYGHAIYPLKAVKNLPQNLRSNLEELRTERVALVSMYLRLKDTPNELVKSLVNFALFDLRCFANFNRPTLIPYTISAIDCYNAYEKSGFMKINNGKIYIDTSKTVEVLKTFEVQLDEITQAENNSDIKYFQNLLQNAQKESRLVRFLVDKL